MLLVKDAIAMIKRAGHDISDEYTSEECIVYLNIAIQQVASLLAEGRYTPLIKEITLHDEESLPKNFMRAAGTYPMRITDGKVKFLEDDNEIRFRYFSTPDLLTETSTVMPFEHDAINQAIVRGAIILALNENEYDLNQDTALWQSLKNAIAGGLGAGIVNS